MDSNLRNACFSTAMLLAMAVQPELVPAADPDPTHTPAPIVTPVQTASPVNSPFPAPTQALPETPDQAAAAKRQAELRQRLIKKLIIPENMTLEELTQSLGKAVPGIEIILRRPNGSLEHPRLPRMTFQDATVGMLVDALQMGGEGFSIQCSIGDDGSHSTLLLGSQSDINVGVKAIALPLSTAVDAIIAKQARHDGGANPMAREDALKALLSLMSATVNPDNSDYGPPQFKVHQETEIVIVRCTETQAESLRQVIKLLLTPDERQIYGIGTATAAP